VVVVVVLGVSLFIPKSISLSLSLFLSLSSEAIREQRRVLLDIIDVDIERRGKREKGCVRSARI
tara:strand:- start:5104 stop:5295 length:192 start_codon:yes stop_codon:yes gene_type:complete